ncbi:MAG: four helix bundle protein [Acutalibacteraceae bacterium]
MNLKVWNMAMDLAEEVNKLVKLLPPEEKFALGDQMRRSSISVPSNIAEGKDRDNDKELAHFLRIAKGSRAELQTQLLLCVRFGYLTKEQTTYAIELPEQIGKMLHGLIQKLN